MINLSDTFLLTFTAYNHSIFAQLGNLIGPNRKKNLFFRHIMGNDGSLGTQNGNEEEKVRPPNRTSFQKELSRINREIEVLQQQVGK